MKILELVTNRRVDLKAFAGHVPHGQTSECIKYRNCPSSTLRSPFARKKKSLAWSTLLRMCNIILTSWACGHITEFVNQHGCLDARPSGEPCYGPGLTETNIAPLSLEQQPAQSQLRGAATTVATRTVQRDLDDLYDDSPARSRPTPALPRPVSHGHRVSKGQQQTPATSSTPGPLESQTRHAEVGRAAPQISTKARSLISPDDITPRAQLSVRRPRSSRAGESSGARDSVSSLARPFSEGTSGSSDADPQVTKKPSLDAMGAFSKSDRKRIRKEDLADNELTEPTPIERRAKARRKIIDSDEST
ncbi:MAG: hypothetical protein M1830_008550 [Pleopsidium flavum]|nr:MAG: hypothetical protein M1830_008550 [Pleopsidium flavum]